MEKTWIKRKRITIAPYFNRRTRDLTMILFSCVKYGRKETIRDFLNKYPQKWQSFLFLFRKAQFFIFKKKEVPMLMSERLKGLSLESGEVHHSSFPTLHFFHSNGYEFCQ